MPGAAVAAVTVAVGVLTPGVAVAVMPVLHRVWLRGAVAADVAVDMAVVERIQPRAADTRRPEVERRTHAAPDRARRQRVRHAGTPGINRARRRASRPAVTNRSSRNMQ
jgi:hypothetical protein